MSVEKILLSKTTAIVSRQADVMERILPMDLQIQAHDLRIAETSMLTTLSDDEFDRYLAMPTLNIEAPIETAEDIDNNVKNGLASMESTALDLPKNFWLPRMIGVGTLKLISLNFGPEVSDIESTHITASVKNGVFDVDARRYSSTFGGAESVSSEEMLNIISVTLMSIAKLPRVTEMYDELLRVKNNDELFSRVTAAGS
jgi:hypothetical protein